MGNPGVVLVHTDEVWLYNSKEVEKKKYQLKDGNIFIKSLERCIISPSSVLINKSFLASIGLFDENLPACEDYDLWLRITAKHDVFLINEQLTIKRSGHENQLSFTTKNLDKYRVIALSKLIRDDKVLVEKKDRAYNVFLKKCEILKKGALKHNNQDVINFIEEIKIQTDRDYSAGLRM